MATSVQRYNTQAQRKKDNARTRILKQNPQARGWVNRVTIVTPRKPNSAKRPVIKVFMKKINRLTAHIPGIGHTLKKFSKILVRGRGPRDLPGVRYSGVRGVLDFIGLRRKKRRRSIYGAEQNDMSKIRARRKYRIAIRKAENERIRKENEDFVYASEQIIDQSLVLFRKRVVYNKCISNFKKKTFFFKNPMLNIRYRSRITVHKLSAEFYCNFLKLNSLYLLGSYSFVFMFFKNYSFSYYNNFFKCNTQQIIIGGYKKQKIKCICSSVLLSSYTIKNYLLCVFFYSSTYRYQQKSAYLPNVVKNYIPPKKHVRQIEQKKKLILLIKKNIEAHQLNNNLKKVVSKTIRAYYRRLPFINFMFLRNKKYYTKKMFNLVKYIWESEVFKKKKKRVFDFKINKSDYLVIRKTSRAYKKMKRVNANNFTNKKLRCI